MVPMRDSEKRVANIAFIDGSGARRYLSPDHILGLYFGFGRGGGPIAIVEGFLRGARFHAEHGGAVAVSFIFANVPIVASIMRERYPDARISLVARDGTTATTEAAATEPPAAESQPSLLRESLHTAATVPATASNPFRTPDSPAQRLYAWVQRKGLTEFTQRQVLQLGPASLRRADVARAALQVLVEQGLLVAAEGDGQYRVAANPEAADGTAEADRSPATAK
jgi:hypothetical protein